MAKKTKKTKKIKKAKKKIRSSSVIKEFLSQYKKEEDFYSGAAKICKERIEDVLSQNGIRAIVSFRAKNPERLFEKLFNRNKKKKYKTVHQILKDIPDLAGVRVALYFPADRLKVSALMTENFIVKKEKKFPLKSKPLHNDYEKRFSGYWATHYRVNLKNINKGLSRYSSATIEIQVASLLMHAWAEVEHDMVYKPKSGELSGEELSILDEINGLVIVGEIALERLQKASESRLGADGTPFKDHFELASYIVSKIKAESATTLHMGRVDKLFVFLKETKINTPKLLGKYIEKLSSYSEAGLLVDQIIDLILSEQPKLYDVWEPIKNSKMEIKWLIARPTPKRRKSRQSSKHGKNEPLALFFKEWNQIERKIRFLGGHSRYTPIGYAISPKSNHHIPLRDRDVSVLNHIRRARNGIVHGTEPYSMEEVAALTKMLKDLNEKLKNG